ncbi:MAG: MCE family protein [Planctomycetes bacterium]|nr:MCE family protein [Planctomycetota bacterium]
MTERQLQFRVGLFVIAAAVVAGVIVFQFSELKNLWEPTYSLAIHFDSAPGVFPSTPVRRNGIAIGKVREVAFDERHGGVVVFVDIREHIRLRADTHPRLVRSLLGDAKIDFTPGTSKQVLPPGSRIEGTAPTDPMQVVGRMEERVNESLATFDETSRQWGEVARNVNGLLDTHRGRLDLVIEQSAESLARFTETMKLANETLRQASTIVGDPQNQENLRRTLAALPEMVTETRTAIASVRSAVGKADENLTNLADVTGPLADRSLSIVTRLDNTMQNLESLSKELDQIAQAAGREDGSLHQLLSNPSLYRNLNASASSLAVLLDSMQPVARDLRYLSDKLARHPELLGVGGALRPSSGVKSPSLVDEIRQSYAPDGALDRQ